MQVCRINDDLLVLHPADVQGEYSLHQQQALYALILSSKNPLMSKFECVGSTFSSSMCTSNKSLIRSNPSIG